MKYTYLIFGLLLWTSCSTPADPKEEVKPKLTSEDLKYIAFIDSVQQLDLSALVQKATHIPDSVFSSQQNMDIVFSPKDFKTLKKACKEEKMKLDFMQKHFPGEGIDALWKIGKYYEFTFYNFSEKDTSLFAIEFSKGFESNVYFFNENRLISKHNVFHKYGFEIEHFKDSDQQTVVYYRQNFESGTGIWWNNYNFFKYMDGKLHPVLNELLDANLDPGFERIFLFETTVASTNPLTLKMVYSNEIKDQTGDNPVVLEADSTFVKYNWNNEKKQFDANFTASRLNRNKITAYTLNADELLVIQVYAGKLKGILKGKDKSQKKVVLNYLKEVQKQSQTQTL